MANKNGQQKMTTKHDLVVTSATPRLASNCVVARRSEIPRSGEVSALRSPLRTGIAISWFGETGMKFIENFTYLNRDRIIIYLIMARFE